MDFLHRDIDQEKVELKTNIFGWVRPGIPLVQTDSSILYQYLWKKSIDTFV